MLTTFRYVVVFRSDTDSAFETVISLDNPTDPSNIELNFEAIAEQARVISRLHDGDKPCSLDGYSVYSIIHNRKTIKKF